METSKPSSSRVSKAKPCLTGLRIAGFQSLVEETSTLVEFRPLTVLAGANSSGKSSLLQPLLLLKQTLESREEPETLVLDGAHVQFASATEFLSRGPGGRRAERLEVELRFAPDLLAKWTFRVAEEAAFSPGVILEAQECSGLGGRMLRFTIGAGLSQTNVEWLNRSDSSRNAKGAPMVGERVHGFVLGRRRRWLEETPEERETLRLLDDVPVIFEPGIEAAVAWLWDLLRVPGSRGRPDRSHRRLAIRPPLRGSFPEYVASHLLRWQELPPDENRVPQVVADLDALGLVDRVVARRQGDTSVELRVPWRRGLPEEARESGWVNMADVGLGVAHALPVVVALHAAGPGQCVYVEQPELHLHPRAQVAMARVLARAVHRGVQVIVETHSATLLLALQALVAEGRELAANDVMLHWFEREETTGATRVRSATLDANGAFGEWPSDFDSVELQLQSRFLDAVERRRRPA